MKTFLLICKYVLIIPMLAAEKFVLTIVEKFDTVVDKADNLANVLIDEIKHPK